MLVVANATPLSELYKIGRLDLLKSVYAHIVIPEAVLQELRRATALPELSRTVEQADWVTVHPIADNTACQALLERHPYIHAGETAAIVLAQELGATRIILDDRRARQVAQSEGLPLIGTVGVLLLAYRLGRLTSSQGQDILDRLFKGDAYIGQQLSMSANNRWIHA